MTKEFSSPKVLGLAKAVLKDRQLCNSCLGRQFAMVSTGMTNRQRGEVIRKQVRSKEPDRCDLCNNLFKKLGEYAEEAEKKVKGIDFETFLVGSKPTPELVKKEEELWEEVGIEYCEPLKSEINRELGKLLQKLLRKDVDKKTPEVVILFNLRKQAIEVHISPLFIYGAYQKLARGIPQTKWEMYPVTVEDIIAKPLMKATEAVAHSMHASGREDIDARCLDWRPFVFQLDSPKKRRIDLKKMEVAVNRSKKVKVKLVRFTDRSEVRKVKSLRPDKTYRVLVICSAPPSEKQLKSLKTLVGIINQRTPTRVAHRRADLMRRRKVKEIRWSVKGKNLQLVVRGEAGLYVKELVTGDSGRTSPSVSSLLGPCSVKELDVIKIHLR